MHPMGGDRQTVPQGERHRAAATVHAPRLPRCTTELASKRAATPPSLPHPRLCHTGCQTHSPPPAAELDPSSFIQCPGSGQLDYSGPFPSSYSFTFSLLQLGLVGPVARPLQQVLLPHDVQHGGRHRHLRLCVRLLRLLLSGWRKAKGHTCDMKGGGAHV